MKLVFALGTRPELIKCAPVIRAAESLGHQVTVISTGQHREMLTGMFKFFGIRPDSDLDVMRPDQGLTGLSARVLESLDRCSLVSRELLAADWFLVQGDTTTAVMAAYWAFCRKLKVAHIEAGLRTHDLAAPFPEEANRQLLSRIATLHLAPTEQAVKALRSEGISAARIRRVGNTSVDALLGTLAQVDRGGVAPRLRLPEEISSFASGSRIALVTAHRRESFGAGFEGICAGILASLKAAPDLKVVFPVHPNPHVRGPAKNLLGRHERIMMVEPLPYVAFTELMRLAEVLVTDSGGIQEEGPTLQKPIIVMREETERPEGVRAGFAKLVGTDPKRIRGAILHALKKGCEGRGRNPYGDGKASERIIKALEAAMR